MALDHCHVPGRSGEADWHLPEGKVEIGLGLHNETVRPGPILQAFLHAILVI